MAINGWDIYFFKSFAERYYALIQEVNELRRKNPDNYKDHAKTKLLKCVHSAITLDIPSCPNHKKYFLGASLGDAYKEWRRAKKGLPQRYRLFFKFSSIKHSIIYAWLNGDYCLRKKGDRNDVYKVFKKMLDKKEIPDNFNELLLNSDHPTPHSA